jgi:predicted Zn-dependent peptidase
VGALRKVACGLLLLAGASGLAQTKASDVETFTLRNGMKFLVLEDYSIPNANMYLFWKVGSRNEYPGITGLSHFFEHMMFNGARKYGPKMFDQVMEANGGSNNAFTTENLTVYTNWFPRYSLEVLFELEADRIRDLTFDDKMIESERGVVLSERSTSLENSSYELLNDYVKASAFFAHPYRWPVIGYESDIRHWSKADLQLYFRTYYAPNNCVVVVTGSVKAEEVKKLAQQYLEPLAAQPEPRQIQTQEPPQTGEKRVTVRKQVTAPHVMIAYHVPEAKSPDAYALDLLGMILTSGNSSRLYSALVDKKQIATEVVTDVPTSFDPNLFYIYAVCSKGVTAETLENNLLDQVDLIIKKGVTDRELEKAKNQKLAQFYHDLETINGKARNLGSYELFYGTYKKLFSAPDDYSAVTPEDIQRVARQYFTKSNRTVGILQANVE